MESSFEKKEKLFWEIAGRFLTFILGIVMVVLPERLPDVSYWQKLFYEPLGIALCCLTVTFVMVRILRAANWMDSKTSNPITYIGFSPRQKVDL